MHRGKRAALAILADFSRRSRRRLVGISDISVGCRLRGLISGARGDFDRGTSRRDETRIPDLLTLFADRRAIKQIVINLLSNAVKFTGQGGHRGDEPANIGSAGPLPIEDNGCGIPESRLEQARPAVRTGAEPVFQEPYRLRSRPRHLALAGRAPGRRLKIRSTEGVGTIVSVRIPANRGDAPRQGRRLDEHGSRRRAAGAHVTTFYRSVVATIRD